MIPFWGVELPRQPGWISWDSVRALVSQVFDIVGHTDTNIDMGSEDAETMRTELEVSKEKISKKWGLVVQLFAYPFGGYKISNSSRKLVRDLGFEFLTGHVWDGSDSVDSACCPGLLASL
jgi:peptidoglycan/xylan/chitin deacetylase (PgdA/CDA1 family)